MPVDRKIKCSSGDRRGSGGRGDFPFFVFRTVHGRKTQWLRGSAAPCQEHELSAPPFSLKIKFCSSTIFAGGVGVLKKKKKIKAISVSVCGWCEMLLVCICDSNESRSCLSESRLLQKAAGVTSSSPPSCQCSSPVTNLSLIL